MNFFFIIIHFVLLPHTRSYNNIKGARRSPWRKEVMIILFYYCIIYTYSHSEAAAAAGGWHEYSDRNILIRSHADLAYIRAKVSGGAVYRRTTRSRAALLQHDRVLCKQPSNTFSQRTIQHVCACHSVEHNIRRISYITVLMYYIMVYHGRGKRSIVLVPHRRSRPSSMGDLRKCDYNNSALSFAFARTF